MDLDRIDRAILRALQEDGRLTIQQHSPTASACRRPPAAGGCRCWRKRASSAAIARRSTPAAVGAPLKLYAFVKLVQRTNAHLDAFESAVRAHPEILSCELVTGVSDYLISIRLPSIEHYDAFLRRCSPESRPWRD